MVATPPTAVAAKATLVATHQLLNSPPPSHTSPSAVEQWCHDIDQLVVAAINTLPHRGWQPPFATHSRTLIVTHMPSATHEQPATHTCWRFLAIEKSTSVQMPIVAFTQEYYRVSNPQGSSNSIISVEWNKDRRSKQY
jgi:hypothetical protein